MSLYHNYSKKRCEPLKPDGCDAVADGHANQCSPKLKIFVIHGSCEEESKYNAADQQLETGIVTPSPAEQMWRQFCAYAQDTDYDWRVYFVPHQYNWLGVDDYPECDTGTEADWEDNMCSRVPNHCGLDMDDCRYNSGCPRGDFACSNGNDVVFVWGKELGCTHDSTDTCEGGEFAIDSWRGIWPYSTGEASSQFVSNLGVLIYEDIVENYYGESLSNVPHPDNNFLCTGTSPTAPLCPTVSGGTYDPPWEPNTIEIINLTDRINPTGEGGNTRQWCPQWTPSSTVDIHTGDGIWTTGDPVYHNCQGSQGQLPCLDSGFSGVAALATITLEYLFNLHEANGTSLLPSEEKQTITRWSKTRDNCTDSCYRTAKAALLTNSMRREIPNPFRDDDGQIVRTETHGKYHVAIIQTPCLFETDEGEYYPEVDVSTIEDILDEHCDRSNWLFIICFLGLETEALPGESVACADEPDGIDSTLIRFLGHKDGQIGDNITGEQWWREACCTGTGLDCIATVQYGETGDSETGRSGCDYRECQSAGTRRCFHNYSWFTTAPCSLHAVYEWATSNWSGGIRDSDIQNHSIVVHRAYTSPVDATDPTFSTDMHHETDPHQLMDWGDTIAGWLGEKFCGFGVDENYCCGPTIGGGTDMDDCASSVSGAIHKNWVDAMYEIVSTTYQGGEIA